MNWEKLVKITESANLELDRHLGIFSFCQIQYVIYLFLLSALLSLNVSKHTDRTHSLV